MNINEVNGKTQRRIIFIFILFDLILFLFKTSNLQRQCRCKSVHWGIETCKLVQISQSDRTRQKSIVNILERMPHDRCIQGSFKPSSNFIFIIIPEFYPTVNLINP